MRSGTSRILTLIASLTCACHSWTPVTLAPKASAELPAHSRVVRRAGAPVPLSRATVTADSVTGTRRDGARYAISRDSVARVDERHFSAGRTMGLVAGLTAGLAALLAIAYASSGDINFGGGY
jgi:hypothetical protein